jgi:hypothetical protein
MDSERTGVPEALVELAVDVGVATGSYGIAGAASGSGSSLSGFASGAPATTAPDPQHEAHTTKADGTPATVHHVDKQFEVASVESR